MIGNENDYEEEEEGVDEKDDADREGGWMRKRGEEGNKRLNCKLDTIKDRKLGCGKQKRIKERMRERKEGKRDMLRMRQRANLRSFKTSLIRKEMYLSIFPPFEVAARVVLRVRNGETRETTKGREGGSPCSLHLNTTTELMEVNQVML